MLLMEVRKPANTSLRMARKMREKLQAIANEAGDMAVARIEYACVDAHTDTITLYVRPGHFFAGLPYEWSCASFKAAKADPSHSHNGLAIVGTGVDAGEIVNTEPTHFS